MAVSNKIAIICLVTRICLTSGILTAKISSDPPRPTSTPPSRPWLSYLPATGGPFPKHPQHAAHAIGLGKAALSDKYSAAGRDTQTGYSRVFQAARPLNDRKQKSQTDYRRYPADIFRDGAPLSERLPNASPSPRTATTTTTMTTTLPEQRDIPAYQRHVPRRSSSYQVIEEPDGYLTDDFYNSKLPYRGKAESTYTRHDPQDVTAAIKILDRFLSQAPTNGDSYNSELHPPPNPVLALVLSRYGRYVPGTRNPRVYAYMAVNNIHNNQPFGNYKLECEEEPIYARR